MTTQEGLRLNFINPELLRAYIHESPHMRPATLAERISGIRETPLAEFPLNGTLFDSIKFILAVEPDQDQRNNRPTAIIRADLQLGNSDSTLTKLHSNTATRREKANYYILAIQEAFNNNPKAQEVNIALVGWSRNTAHIRTFPLQNEQDLTLLQIYDPDAGPGSISISLLSHSKYRDVWMHQHSAKTALDSIDEQKRGGKLIRKQQQMMLIVGIS